MDQPFSMNHHIPRNGRNCDLISEYGQIPYDAIKTQSEVYWKYGGAKTVQRAAQTMK